MLKIIKTFDFIVHADLTSEVFLITKYDIQILREILYIIGASFD